MDSHSGQRDDVWIGRTQADAPDIDCVVYITAPDTNPLTPLAGKIVPVQMVAAAGYDLAGVATEISVARQSVVDFLWRINVSRCHYVGENVSRDWGLVTVR